MLVIDHPVDEFARPHRTRVDVEIVEAMVGVCVDCTLLRLQHRFVFPEHAGNAFPQFVGSGLIGQVVVSSEGPKIETGFFRRGGYRIEDIAVYAARSITVACTGSRGSHAHIDRDRAGSFKTNDLPSVHLARPAILFAPEGRRVDVFHPSADIGEPL